MTAKCPVIVVFVLLVVCAGSALADTYMLSANALGIPKGNYGTSYFVSPALTLTARTKMTPTLPYGLAGTVYLHDKDGAGVQDELAGGSKEISGGGPAEDEALVFTFSTPVFTDSPTLLLNKFDPAGSDVELVVTLHDGSIVYVPTTTVDLKTVKVDKDSYTLAFADLPELVGKGPLDTFYVRTWEGHSYVDGLYVDPIPEPGTMTLMGLGLLGLAARIRKRKSTQVS